MDNSRRNFIKKSFTGSAAFAFGGVLPGFSARSYRHIIGSNERINIASMGVNSRGLALGTNFPLLKNCEIAYACDVDVRAAEKFRNEVEKIQKKRPKAQPDFRKALEDKDVDALVVAAPDHWHAPAAILACQAGKHVYVEKPCSHNPHEGELLVAAAQKYKRAVQMGNQRRSWPNVAAAIAEIKAGVIGNAYYAKAWYTNNRPSIGKGIVAPVPDWLDYDLWQGPAPRRPFRNNLIHYNWHWFWHWGTGEALNNGTHMVDVARWGLGVDFPVKVSSSGGRYRYDDDWETPDTQVINLEFNNKKMISWEGRSCNGTALENTSTGVIFYGEKGSLMVTENNSYVIYDLKTAIIKKVDADQNIDIRNAISPSQALDAYHLQNFLDAIRNNTPLNSGIESGYISTLLVQLGNIAQRAGHDLNTDPLNGHILHDDPAVQYWSRTYEPGWEPKL